MRKNQGPEGQVDPAETSGAARTPFSFDATDDGKQLRIRVHAEKLDASTATDFKQAAAKRWPSKLEELVVDLHPVRFIDSSGVGVLLHLQRKAYGSDRPLRLEGVRPAVRHVIGLLRLDRVFAITEA